MMVVGGVANESQRKQKVMNGMRATLSLLVGAAIAMTTSVAYAQDIGGSSAPASGGSSGGSITDTSGPTDHSQVVGHLALRYFGSTTMAVLGVAEPPGFDTARDAGERVGRSARFAHGRRERRQPTLHTVGALLDEQRHRARRRHLDRLLVGQPLDATPADRGTNAVTTDVPNFFGIGLQLGVPVMLAESKHLSINLTPLLGFHYATSAITTGTDDNAADQSGRSIQFTLGANAAASFSSASSAFPSSRSRPSSACSSATRRRPSSRFRAARSSRPRARATTSASAPRSARTTASATSSAARSASSTTSATRPRAELT
ncbi:MAG: hypothetical protein U0326_28605 [Polyangiales bacterium]